MKENIILGDVNIKITKKRLVKVYSDGYHNVGGFEEIAEFITSVAVKNNVSDNEKDLISGGIALGMGMGYSLDRHKHLMVGCLYGAVGTGLVLMVYNKFKKKEVVVTLGELVEVMGPILKKDLEEHNNKEI